ncbi:type II toxin-antitoxin system RelE/ParE family toxin [Pseudomonas sp. UBA1879]|uniref:type II toxin-antitoxin system RelE/ParE family toxin n=1 Tax=Pseudomonas sp. UBA1879 TaxID=1947305 RepID=UPI0025E28897|nr:type II toxin-antitoxin system RelE/ParE family toxin [Pseudomonas sp. UBA1879]
MLKIALTDKAQSDLEALHDYYTGNSGLEAANRIVIEMLEALEPLMTFTGLGRPSQSPDIREFVFTRYPYVAPYRVKNNEIQILRVLHQRVDR